MNKKKEAIALAIEVWTWRRDHPLEGEYEMPYHLYDRIATFSNGEIGPGDPLCTVFQDDLGVCHGCPFGICDNASIFGKWSEAEFELDPEASKEMASKAIELLEKHK